MFFIDTVYTNSYLYYYFVRRDMLLGLIETAALTSCDKIEF